ncbi:MAG: hypothetical protein SGI73_15845 [Chloroflexota bacterium]|nr:hypothetical protein [Chloroflexota bacterium]
MKKGLLLLGMLLTLLFTVVSVSAGARNLVLTPDCTAYDAAGGTLNGERDNTGRRSESFVVRVSDGRGELIYDLVIEVPVGGRYDFEAGSRYRYPLRARANPLTLTVISLGGRGLAAQTLYTNTANCATLPGGSAAEAVANDPNNLPRPVNAPGVAEANAAYGIVNIDNLNVRTGDAVRYARIAIVDGGTTLILLGTNGAEQADSLWWYVQVGGVRGWVKGEFIILRGDASDLNVIETRGALGEPYFILGVDNLLRTVPSPGASVICTVPGGINYPVIGKDATEASWFKIEAPCNGVTVVGWVQAEAGFLRNESDAGIPVP